MGNNFDNRFGTLLYLLLILFGNGYLYYLVITSRIDQVAPLDKGTGKIVSYQPSVAVELGAIGPKDPVLEVGKFVVQGSKSTI